MKKGKTSRRKHFTLKLKLKQQAMNTLKAEKRKTFFSRNYFPLCFDAGKICSVEFSFFLLNFFLPKTKHWVFKTIFETFYQRKFCV
jgi:hypothetical protein